MNWRIYIKRLDSLANDIKSGSQYVGRYYDELTDGEQLEYLCYYYGQNSGITPETIDKIEAIFDKQRQKHFI